MKNKGNERLITMTRIKVGFTVLAVVLPAHDEGRRSALDREDVTLANACHAVRLAL